MIVDYYKNAPLSCVLQLVPTCVDNPSPVLQMVPPNYSVSHSLCCIRKIML